MQPSNQPPHSRRHWWLWALLIVGCLIVLGLADALGSNSKALFSPAPTSAPISVSPKQQIKQIAVQTTHIGQIQKSEYNSVTGTATITEYLDTNKQINHPLIITSIKNDCFNIQQSLWTANLGYISATKLDITAPLQDKYGNVKTGELAYCSLTKATAAQFNWNNLLPDSAWSDYDTQWYLSSLNT